MTNLNHQLNFNTNKYFINFLFAFSLHEQNSIEIFVIKINLNLHLLSILHELMQYIIDSKNYEIV